MGPGGRVGAMVIPTPNGVRVQRIRAPMVGTCRTLIGARVITLYGTASDGLMTKGFPKMSACPLTLKRRGTKVMMTINRGIHGFGVNSHIVNNLVSSFNTRNVGDN